MRLEQVVISNFKGIEECTIELEDGFNLLLGDNGYGKTSILEAISVGLGGYIAGIADVSARNFTKEEIRVILEKTGDGSFNRRYKTPVSVKCRAVVEDEKFEWTRKKAALKLHELQLNHEPFVGKQSRCLMKKSIFCLF